MQYFKNSARRPVNFSMTATKDHNEVPCTINMCMENKEASPASDFSLQRNDTCGSSLAMAYVPFQTFQELNDPAKALECGTLFRELYMPFYGQRRRLL